MPLRTWADTNGVRYAHVYNMARRGEIPVVRLGRRIYVHLRSMERWVSRGAQPDDLVRFELSEGNWITRLRDDLEQRP
jgi:predicted site-specific integrase-resolvase